MYESPSDRDEGQAMGEGVDSQPITRPKTDRDLGDDCATDASGDDGDRLIELLGEWEERFRLENGTAPDAMALE